MTNHNGRHGTESISTFPRSTSTTRRRLAVIALVIVAATYGWFATTAPNAHAITIGTSTSNGFTMHWSVDLYGTTKIGWTVQPNSTAAIDNWIRGNPQTVAAGTAAMAMAGAAACTALLPGLGSAVCAAMFAVWLGYLIDTFHNAHLVGDCVTEKIYIPLYSVFDPNAIHWSAYPYVDSGSWCNKTYYPPPIPDPQGPRTPGGCAMDPTNIDCSV